MEGIWHKEWSEELGRDMEYKVVGRGGKLCLAFPPQGGRFFDFEDNGMVEVLDPWVASGRLQVVLVDGIDNESWSNSDGDEHERAVQQERWFRYVTNELLPTVRPRTRLRWPGRAACHDHGLLHGRLPRGELLLPPPASLLTAWWALRPLHREPLLPGIHRPAGLRQLARGLPLQHTARPPLPRSLPPLASRARARAWE